MKIKVLLASLIGLILVWCLSSKNTIEDGFTHQLDFENKLKEYSNGTIKIKDSSIEYREKENDSVYTANWNGFTIYSKMGKNDWLSNSYSVTTEKQVFEDKKANEQYRKLMKSIIRIADPKLSIKEVNRLIDRGVDLNELKGKEGFYYQLKVGQDPVNTISFTIVPKDGF
ncbi:hypothetical protein [Bacillus multifaciens]|uniref:hypothetical protein n=1 Tax=Bacillus multifaciens TaxID=3068506 RepID=UPI0027403C63|nr:hypothetical protein [Bacillus sp. WLY-B-L8]MDP7980003.1 hypothetical protein [Bacillus sp. WLY-B-L8]